MLPQVIHLCVQITVSPHSVHVFNSCDNGLEKGTVGVYCLRTGVMFAQLGWTDMYADLHAGLCLLFLTGVCAILRRGLQR